MTCEASNRSAAWVCNTSATIATGYAAGAWFALPDAETRAALHQMLVFSLGYGHLLSSMLLGRSARNRIGPYRSALRIAVLAFAYLIYVNICTVWPLFPVGLLAISAWHTVENDRALRRTPLSANHPIAPLSMTFGDVRKELLAAGGLSAAALVLPSAFPMFTTIDVVAAFSLHHLVTWLLLTITRARSRGRTGATLRLLARLHMPMILISTFAMLISAPRGLAGETLEAAAELVLSPGTYLFWSAAHVVHTAMRRVNRASPR